MQVPHKRLLTPRVAPPSLGLGAGSWHWLTPRDIIPALPVEHEMHIEFALWVALVIMESGEKAVEVATAPGNASLLLVRPGSRAGEGHRGDR